MRAPASSASARKIASEQVARFFPRTEKPCPRCGKLTAEGLIITLNGPFRGLRCADCWEAEA